MAADTKVPRYKKFRICLKQLRRRDVGVCLVACLAYKIICPAAAQGFAPIPSCTNDLSSFAGIVCSGDADTGKVMHCVLNEHFQTVLVCTEWSLIPAGRCPQYLEQPRGIDDFACVGSELCSRGPFRSYEVYKYPACLNSSLYITEPTTTPKDITEQPSTCRDCGDGGSTGQSMSCAVPIVITVIVLMAISCALIVWEYRTGNNLLGVICGRLKNGSCGHSTTGTQQVPQGQAEEPAQGHLMSGQGSAAGTNQQYQPV